MAVTFEVRGDKAFWGGRLLRDWVPVLVDRLVSEFNPAMIVLLGSVAHGSDGPDSDVDLLVVLDHAPRSQLYDVLVEMHRTTRDCAAPTDFVVTSVDKLKRRRDRPGTIEYESVHNGKVVYDRRAA
jgi:polymorphic toxin system nucleotidyltransferase-like protein